MLHVYSVTRSSLSSAFAGTELKDQFAVNSQIKTNKLHMQMKTGKFWRENFPVTLKTNKRDSGTLYPGLTKNEPLKTWLNLFLGEFNQKGRRINKKARSHWQKQALNILMMMQTRSRNGPVHYGKVMTASQSVSAKQDALFHRK